MSKLNRFSGRARRSIFALASLCVATTLSVGCASNPSRVERAFADDHPEDWASRVAALPVEIHGAMPGETAAQTAATIDHGTADQAGAKSGTSGLSLYAMPRVVVYIGGAVAPARDQYCTLDPDTNRSVVDPKNALVVRSELCDGPRAVAYTRITLPEANPTAHDLARSMERIKSDLVRSLPPLDPMLQPDYWN
jgi:hypothetical protein